MIRVQSIHFSECNAEATSCKSNERLTLEQFLSVLAQSA